MMHSLSVVVVDPEKRNILSGLRLEICSAGCCYSVFYGHEPQIVELKKASATLYSEGEEPVALFSQAEGVCLIERSRVVCLLCRSI